MGEWKCQNCLYLETLLHEEKKKHVQREKIIEVLKDLLLTNHNNYIKGTRESLSEYQKKAAKDHDDLRMRLITVMDTNKALMDKYNLTLKEKQELQVLNNDLETHVEHAKLIIRQLWSCCKHKKLPKGKKSNLLKELHQLDLDVRWDKSEVPSVAPSVADSEFSSCSPQINDITYSPDSLLSPANSSVKSGYENSPKSDLKLGDDFDHSYQLDRLKTPVQQYIDNSHKYDSTDTSLHGIVSDRATTKSELQEPVVHDTGDTCFADIFCHDESVNTINGKEGGGEFICNLRSGEQLSKESSFDALSSNERKTENNKNIIVDLPQPKSSQITEKGRIKTVLDSEKIERGSLNSLRPTVNCDVISSCDIKTKKSLILSENSTVNTISEDKPANLVGNKSPKVYNLKGRRKTNNLVKSQISNPSSGVGIESSNKDVSDCDYSKVDDIKSVGAHSDRIELQLNSVLNKGATSSLKSTKENKGTKFNCTNKSNDKEDDKTEIHEQSKNASIIEEPIVKLTVKNIDPNTEVKNRMIVIDKGKTEESPSPSETRMADFDEVLVKILEEYDFPLLLSPLNSHKDSHEENFKKTSPESRQINGLNEESTSGMNTSEKTSVNSSNSIKQDMMDNKTVAPCDQSNNYFSDEPIEDVIDFINKLCKDNLDAIEPESRPTTSLNREQDNVELMNSSKLIPESFQNVENVNRYETAVPCDQLKGTKSESVCSKFDISENQSANDANATDHETRAKVFTDSKLFTDDCKNTSEPISNSSQDAIQHSITSHDPCNEPNNTSFETIYGLLDNIYDYCNGSFGDDVKTVDHETRPIISQKSTADECNTSQTISSDRQCLQQNNTTDYNLMNEPNFIIFDSSGDTTITSEHKSRDVIDLNEKPTSEEYSDPNVKSSGSDHDIIRENVTSEKMVVPFEQVKNTAKEHIEDALDDSGELCNGSSEDHKSRDESGSNQESAPKEDSDSNEKTTGSDQDESLENAASKEMVVSSEQAKNSAEEQINNVLDDISELCNGPSEVNIITTEHNSRDVTAFNQESASEECNNDANQKTTGNGQDIIQENVNSKEMVVPCNNVKKIAEEQMNNVLNDLSIGVCEENLKNLLHKSGNIVSPSKDSASDTNKTHTFSSCENVTKQIETSHEVIVSCNQQKNTSNEPFYSIFDISEDSIDDLKTGEEETSIFNQGSKVGECTNTSGITFESYQNLNEQHESSHKTVAPCDQLKRTTKGPDYEAFDDFNGHCNGSNEDNLVCKERKSDEIVTPSQKSDSVDRTNRSDKTCKSLGDIIKEQVPCKETVVPCDKSKNKTEVSNYNMLDNNSNDSFGSLKETAEHDSRQELTLNKNLDGGEIKNVKTHADCPDVIELTATISPCDQSERNIAKEKIESMFDEISKHCDYLFGDSECTSENECDIKTSPNFVSSTHICMDVLETAFKINPKTKPSSPTGNQKVVPNENSTSNTTKKTVHDVSSIISEHSDDSDTDSFGGLKNEDSLSKLNKDDIFGIILGSNSDVVVEELYSGNGKKVVACLNLSDVSDSNPDRKDQPQEVSEHVCTADDLYFGSEEKELTLDTSHLDIPRNIYSEHVILPALTPLPPSPRLNYNNAKHLKTSELKTPETRTVKGGIRQVKPSFSLNLSDGKSSCEIDSFRSKLRKRVNDPRRCSPEVGPKSSIIGYKSVDRCTRMKKIHDQTQSKLKIETNKKSVSSKSKSTGTESDKYFQTSVPSQNNSNKILAQDSLEGNSLVIKGKQSVRRSRKSLVCETGYNSLSRGSMSPQDDINNEITSEPNTCSSLSASDIAYILFGSTSDLDGKHVSEECNSFNNENLNNKLYEPTNDETPKTYLLATNSNNSNNITESKISQHKPGSKLNCEDFVKVEQRKSSPVLKCYFNKSKQLVSSGKLKKSEPEYTLTQKNGKDNAYYKYNNDEAQNTFLSIDIDYNLDKSLNLIDWEEIKSTLSDSVCEKLAKIRSKKAEHLLDCNVDSPKKISPRKKHLSDSCKAQKNCPLGPLDSPDMPRLRSEALSARGISQRTRSKTKNVKETDRERLFRKNNDNLKSARKTVRHAKKELDYSEGPVGNDVSRVTNKNVPLCVANNTEKVSDDYSDLAVTSRTEVLEKSPSNSCGSVENKNMSNPLLECEVHSYDSADSCSLTSSVPTDNQTSHRRRDLGSDDLRVSDSRLEEKRLCTTTEVESGNDSKKLSRRVLDRTAAVLNNLDPVTSSLLLDSSNERSNEESSCDDVVKEIVKEMTFLNDLELVTGLCPEVIVTEPQEIEDCTQTEGIKTSLDFEEAFLGFNESDEVNSPEFADDSSEIDGRLYGTGSFDAAAVTKPCEPGVDCPDVENRISPDEVPVRFGFYNEIDSEAVGGQLDGGEVQEDAGLKRKSFDEKSNSEFESRRKVPKIVSEDEMIPCTSNALRCALSYLSEEVLNNQKVKKKPELCSKKGIKALESNMLQLINASEDEIAGVFSTVLNSMEEIDVSPGHIADIIVDIVCEDEGEEDMTDTPPAPPLTVVQKRLMMLIVSLADKNCSLIGIVLKTFEDLLVSFTAKKNDKSKPLVEGNCRLVGFHTALCFNQGLLKRARTLMFDLLYTRDFKAFPLIFKMISIWPEVFPLAPGCILTQTIAFEVFCKSHLGVKTKFMLAPLKSLLSNFGYEEAESYTRDMHCTEIIKKLTHEGSGLALVLLCKIEGWKWAKQVVETNLLPIVQEWLQGKNDAVLVSEAILSIGRIVRAIPGTDAYSMLRPIFELLENVLLSDASSPMVQESTVEAISLLRNHNLYVCALILAKWRPKAGYITKKMANFMRIVLTANNLTYWHKFLASHEAKS